MKNSQHKWGRVYIILLRPYVSSSQYPHSFSIESYDRKTSVWSRNETWRYFSIISARPLCPAQAMHKIFCARSSMFTSLPVDSYSKNRNTCWQKGIPMSFRGYRREEWSCLRQHVSQSLDIDSIYVFHPIDISRVIPSESSLSSCSCHF